MPYENEHSCRLKDPSSLDGADRVARVKKEDGRIFITGFWGPKGKPTKAVTQAIRYPKASFTADKARADCKRLGGTFEAAASKTSLSREEEQIEELIIEYSEFAKEEPETYDIYNKEIVVPGTWDAETGKLTITNKDIDSLMKTYDELKNTGNHKIPMKLGHDEKQKFLQKHGLPAAGWVENLRKVVANGVSKIVGDIKYIPKAIYKIIKNKGYVNVSPEIIRNYKYSNTGKKYDSILDRVAFLGIEHPAMDLDELEAMYASKDNITETIVFKMDRPIINDFDETQKLEVNMNEVEMLTRERDELKAKVERFSSEAETSAKEKEELENSLDEANEKLEKFKKDSHNTKVDVFIEKYKTDKKILPSQEANVRIILDNIAKDEVVKFSKDGKEEEGNAFDLVGSILDLNPDLVELDEFSRETEDNDIKGETKEADGTPMEDVEEATKVDKFMKENKITDAREGYDRARREGVI